MKARNSLEQDASAEKSRLARSAMGAGAAAKAAVVNRTHRVVRERARSLQASRSRMRGLMLPMLLSSTMMLMVFCSIWSVLDGYDLAAEMPALSNHVILVLLWFVPVSGALVAMVWFRRSRQAKMDFGSAR